MIIIVIIIIVIIVRPMVVWKGTNEVSTNGVAANKEHVCLTEGLLEVLPLTYYYLPESARAYLCYPIYQTSLIIFAAAPLVLTPFVRNQFVRRGERSQERQQERPGRARTLVS